MHQCRICQHSYSPLMSFGQMPLANGFLAQEDFEREYFFELQVGFCEKCKAFQLIEQPEPQKMFHENYAFFSGTSALMAAHFAKFAESIRSDFLAGDDPFVVEIGSNDGILLKNFAEAGIRHLGIEPSANVAAVAREKGINTAVKFFDEHIAQEIVHEYGQADAFLAANVMCHLPHLPSVVEGIRILLKHNGIVAFEDPYLGDVIEKTSYDQIYDEHVFLFSLASISHLFEAHGMEVVDLKPQSTHGGSMRFYIAHKGSRLVSPAVAMQRQKETELGLGHAETYQAFRSSCEQSRVDLQNLLSDLKGAGKRVVGYAATSKGTTILNYCDITSELIEFISDTTPIKQGKYSPGMHIPVCPAEKFASSLPDYAFLFAWNHEREIRKKEQRFEKVGGKWILHVPKVRVL